MTPSVPRRAAPALLLALAGCAAAPGPPEGDGRESLAMSLAGTLWGRGGRFLGSTCSAWPGLLVTARHVLAGQGPGEVEADVAGSRRLLGRPLDIGPGLDAAVFALDGLEARVDSRRVSERPVRDGEPLFVAGADAGRPSSGRGRALGPPLALPPFLPGVGRSLVTALLPARPGFSGGPVLDGDGLLLGIVVAAIAPSRARAERAAREPGPRPVLVLPIEEVRAALGA